MVIFFDPDLLPFMELYKVLTKSIIVFDNHEDYPSYLMVKESIPLLVRKVVKDSFLLLFRFGKRVLDYIFYSDQFTSGIDHRQTNEAIIYNFPIITIFPAVEKKFDVIYPGSIDLNICQRLLNIAGELEKSSNKVISFLIIGRDVSDANREQIHEFISNHRRIKVEFFEDLPYPEVQNYISASRIGIIPMPDIEKFRRNIPTKMFEYMMHAIPIVASNLPAISFFLKDMKGSFLINETNYASDYGKKILEILSDYPYFEALSKKDFSHLVDNWNWEKTEAPKLNEIIHMLMKKTKTKTTYKS